MDQTVSIQKSKINNQFYNDLGERWYQACDDPIALLRAESRLRNPWILDQLTLHFERRPLKILDLACGAGFLANELSRANHQVTGVDLSEESLKVAQAYDSTHRVRYELMDAHHLNFKDGTFDVICAMDFLEHVTDTRKVLKEISRTLKPNGLFFFHTFNRNWLSYLIVIKGVEWFIKNTPKHMHIYDLLLKPSELKEQCSETNLSILTLQGIRPRLTLPFFKMLLTGNVPPDFQFTFTRSTLTGYVGIAKKTDDL